MKEFPFSLRKERFTVFIVAYNSAPDTFTVYTKRILPHCVFSLYFYLTTT